MKIKFSWILLVIIIAMVGCASSSTDTSSDSVASSENDLFDELKEEANSIEESEKAADELESKFSAAEKPSIDQIEKENNGDATALAATTDSFTNLEKTENGMEYYTAVGGEMPVRIAVGIYGDRKSISKIYDMNPSLRDIKNIEAGTKVYFSMANAEPKSEYLTKDMLVRYKEELLGKIQDKRKRMEGNTGLLDITVQKGDTLQSISQSLYGTVRFWTELYILNQNKVSNFDTLKPGITISYYPVVDFLGNQKIAGSNPVVSPAEQTPIAQNEVEQIPEPASPKEEQVQASTNTNMNTQARTEPNQEMTSDSPQIVKGGIPVDVEKETIEDLSNQAAPPSAQPAQVAASGGAQGELKRIRPQPEDIAADDESFLGKNLRRFIYVGFIALIIIGGYFMTRPSSGLKKNKFAGIQPMPVNTPNSSSSSGLGSRGRINRSGSSYDEKKTG